MAQIIKSNEDKLTFGKYNGYDLSNIPISYIFWAIKVQAIIIDNNELQLHLYKRRDSFHESMRYISNREGNWADMPLWGDDY